MSSLVRRSVHRRIIIRQHNRRYAAASLPVSSRELHLLDLFKYSASFESSFLSDVSDPRTIRISPKALRAAFDAVCLDAGSPQANAATVSCFPTDASGLIDFDAFRLTFDAFGTHLFTDLVNIVSAVDSIDPDSMATFAHPAPNAAAEGLASSDTDSLVRSIIVDIARADTCYAPSGAVPHHICSKPRIDAAIGAGGPVAAAEPAPPPTVWLPTQLTFLVGPPGSGRSTVANAIADAYSLSVVSVDTLLGGNTDTLPLAALPAVAEGSAAIDTAGADAESHEPSLRAHTPAAARAAPPSPTAAADAPPHDGAAPMMRLDAGDPSGDCDAVSYSDPDVVGDIHAASHGDGHGARRAPVSAPHADAHDVHAGVLPEARTLPPPPLSTDSTSLGHRALPSVPLLSPAARAVVTIPAVLRELAAPAHSAGALVIGFPATATEVAAVVALYDYMADQHARRSTYPRPSFRFVALTCEWEVCAARLRQKVAEVAAGDGVSSLAFAPQSKVTVATVASDAQGAVGGHSPATHAAPPGGDGAAGVTLTVAAPAGMPAAARPALVANAHAAYAAVVGAPLVTHGVTLHGTAADAPLGGAAVPLDGATGAAPFAAASLGAVSGADDDDTMPPFIFDPILSHRLATLPPPAPPQRVCLRVPKLPRAHWLFYQHRTLPAMSNIAHRGVRFGHAAIRSEGSASAVRSRVLDELQRQEGLELSPDLAAALATFPTSAQLTRDAHASLVRRLDAYPTDSPATLDAVVDLLRADFFPIIEAHVASGLATVRSTNPILRNPTALRAVLDILTERGYIVAVDVKKADAVSAPSHWVFKVWYRYDCAPLDWDRAPIFNF